MQFTDDMTEAILEGRKTCTTRPAPRMIPANHPDEWTAADECRYKVGHDYAVCPGRGKHQVCRILILHVACWPDYTLPPASERYREGHARREGFTSAEEWRVRWRELYAKDRTRREGPVWVIDFELWKGAEHGS